MIAQRLKSTLKAISECFQIDFRAIPERLWSVSIAIAEQLHSDLRAISERVQSISKRFEAIQSDCEVIVKQV
jgi:hypothetical protein